MNPQVHLSIFDAILDASPIVQLVLLMLIALSVLCWGVAFFKFKQFKVIESSDPEFIAEFWKAKSLEDLAEAANKLKDSSVARVFTAGFSELQKLSETPTGGLLRSNVDNLQRALHKAVDSEVAGLEAKLSLLATTGSTGPFIGLFGTVWGIMNAFQKIGIMGSASLAVVAPGIAEALVATAIGLAAAIPAVALYNHFINRLKKQERELNNFATDFLNLAQRNFLTEGK